MLGLLVVLLPVNGTAGVTQFALNVAALMSGEPSTGLPRVSFIDADFRLARFKPFRFAPSQRAVMLALKNAFLLIRLARVNAFRVRGVSLLIVFLSIDSAIAAVQLGLKTAAFGGC